MYLKSTQPQSLHVLIACISLHIPAYCILHIPPAAYRAVYFEASSPGAPCLYLAWNRAWWTKIDQPWQWPHCHCFECWGAKEENLKGSFLLMVQLNWYAFGSLLVRDKRQSWAIYNKPLDCCSVFITNLSAHTRWQIVHMLCLAWRVCFAIFWYFASNSCYLGALTHKLPERFGSHRFDNQSLRTYHKQAVHLHDT